MDKVLASALARVRTAAILHGDADEISFLDKTLKENFSRLKEFYASEEFEKELNVAMEKALDYLRKTEPNLISRTKEAVERVLAVPGDLQDQKWEEKEDGTDPGLWDVADAAVMVTCGKPMAEAKEHLIATEMARRVSVRGFRAAGGIEKTDADVVRRTAGAMLPSIRERYRRPSDTNEYYVNVAREGLMYGAFCQAWDSHTGPKPTTPVRGFYCALKILGKTLPFWFRKEIEESTEALSIVRSSEEFEKPEESDIANFGF